MASSLDDRTVNTLASYFANDGRFSLPANYLTLDLETTGGRRDWDLITEIGHCAVVDRQPVQVMSTILDWTRCDWVNQRWLQDKLESITRRIRKSGGEYHITYERMVEEGHDPTDVLDFYRSLCDKLVANRSMMVCHNGYHCDHPFMSHAFQEILNRPFKMPDWFMLDTGALVKAAQTGWRPEPKESRADFCIRVVRKRATGVFWSLDRYCLEAFELDKRYGLQREDLHTAGMDAYATHCLVEEIRWMLHESTKIETKESQARDEHPVPRRRH